MMLIDEFNFDLPEELIAIYPRKERSSSKLLILKKESGEIIHTFFRNLPEIITDEYMMVINNTKVIPARLILHKETGGKIEVLLDRPTGEKTWTGIFSASRPPKKGSYLIFNSVNVFKVINVEKNLIALEFTGEDFHNFLKKAGEVPLPPYILKRREGVVLPDDRDFYQTIYAKKDGAVAAPTAGMHFDKKIWAALKEREIKFEEITLHVGIGTFLPVKEKEVEKHQMHPERVSLSLESVEKIKKWKEDGGKILAVGTTTVRALEGVVEKFGELKNHSGEVDIFIYPGYKFKVVDAMLTNFHLPKSTLILLVAAFAGKEKILRAYNEAIKKRYKFFSYGDAMLII